MRKHAGSLAILCFAAMLAFTAGAQGQVVTVAVPDVNMLADTTTSFTLTLLSEPQDTLEGFTLLVDMVPQGDAVGDLTFTAVTEPATDYVFAGNSMGFMGQIGSPTMAGGMDVTATGSVTLSEVKNAITFEINAAAGASGHWDLVINPVALDGRTGTETTADNGVVTVLPEPASLLLLGAGGLFCSRRRRG